MSSVYYIINIYNIYTISCNYNQFILILIMKKLLYFSMVIKIIPHVKALSSTLGICNRL